MGHGEIVAWRVRGIPPIRKEREWMGHGEIVGLIECPCLG